MKLLIFYLYLFTHFGKGENEFFASKQDLRVLNATIAKYGPPKDYTIFNLPGPEILVDDDLLSHSVRFNVSANEENYTIWIRTVTDNFSYNSRYEQTELQHIDLESFPVVKGQFGEHFERKNGSFYIRTIGYVLDQSGYHEFLIDISTTETTIKEVEPPIDGNGTYVNRRPPAKIQISSTVLGSLVGGNSLG
ncbi:uncharacterized protein LOC123013581 [Tribolium madens]|uniref:uncharacterized protein LOC123013581 n=1 Tax=Tribolium madens TaxID=41895 RepID=UPI001CF7521F|nr:uncharacterized protein LOC123013581 [Tribolium madens]